MRGHANLGILIMFIIGAYSYTYVSHLDNKTERELLERRIESRATERYNEIIRRLDNEIIRRLDRIEDKVNEKIRK